MVLHSVISVSTTSQGLLDGNWYSTWMSFCAKKVHITVLVTFPAMVYVVEVQLVVFLVFLGVMIVRANLQFNLLHSALRFNQVLSLAKQVLNGIRATQDCCWLTLRRGTTQTSGWNHLHHQDDDNMITIFWWQRDDNKVLMPVGSLGTSQTAFLTSSTSACQLNNLERWTWWCFWWLSC